MSLTAIPELSLCEMVRSSSLSPPCQLFWEPACHRPCGGPAPPLPILKDLVQDVAAIVSVGTHLACPAAGLARLCPFGTDKDLRTIYFIYGTVTRALVADNLRAAAD